MHFRKKAKRILRNDPTCPLYTNSENALALLDTHLHDSSFARHAQLFKDKGRFRELIQNHYPSSCFRTIKLDEIPALSTQELSFPLVIKPSVGFFSIGVHVIKNQIDWEIARKALNYENLKSVYPGDVLVTTTFIIEEYLEGEEFAVDCYFNKFGDAVILNIPHHKFSSGNWSTGRN